MCEYKFEIGEEVIPTPALACGRDGVSYNERMKELAGRIGVINKRMMRGTNIGHEEFYRVSFGGESWYYFADWLKSVSSLVKSNGVDEFLSEFEVIE